MSTTTRPRRLLTAAVATFTVSVLALVTACGGSAVTGRAAGGTTAAQITDESTAETDVAAGTAPGAPIPASGAGTTVGTGPKTGGGSSSGVTGTRPNTGAATDPTKPVKPGKTTTQTKPAKPDETTTTATGGSAVARLVANSPIFGGSAVCKPATLSEVNIGNVSTLSGVLGELLGPVRPALQTFVASQNACGGLNGHKIKFFQSDDQGDPATAVTRVQELIEKQKVLAFVGNIQVLTIDAIIPTIKRFGIPLIGGDITNNTWFTNPLAFPQGSGPQSVSYGHLVGAKDYHKASNVGNLWCIEVPRACEQINRAMKELAPMVGIPFVKDVQVSITQPSYVQQCLDFKNAKVESLVMSLDAASMVRLGRSCTQVGYHPKLMAYPLSLGNEKQFLGSKWLANTYVANNVFPWMGNATAAEKYYQESVRKYNPGFTTGGAASLGWTAGALLVAASAGLSETNPTTQQLLDTLYSFNGQKFTELGGLSGPKTFRAGGIPKVPYCLFPVVSNDDNSGWQTPASKPTCTDILAPSDPQTQR